MIHVAAPVQIRNHLDGLFPSILRREPAGGAGEEEHADEQDRGRDGLDAPRDAERRRALRGIVRAAIGKGGAVLHEVLHQDPPGDGPLLERDDPSADLGGRDLGLVDGHDGGFDPDPQPGDDASDDEHFDALGCALQAAILVSGVGGRSRDGACSHRPYDPDQCRALDGHDPRVSVGDEGGCEGAEEGSGGHGTGDGTLPVAPRDVEVGAVGVGPDHARHGGDIEAEQPAT